MIGVTDQWKAAFPRTSFAILAMEGVRNVSQAGTIEAMTAATALAVRDRHRGKTRREIGGEAPYEAYEAYFRRFGQGYPVLHQVETVALKGREIISPSPLVAVLFMTELDSGLLSAGHDLGKVALPLLLDVADGKESYRTLGGRQRQLKEGDMFLSDGKGILSSVLYGPDDGSFISEATTKVLFTVYGVPGVSPSALEEQMAKIAAAVEILSPGASTTAKRIVP